MVPGAMRSGPGSAHYQHHYSQHQPEQQHQQQQQGPGAGGPLSAAPPCWRRDPWGVQQYPHHHHHQQQHHQQPSFPQPQPFQQLPGHDAWQWRAPPRTPPLSPPPSPALGPAEAPAAALAAPATAAPPHGAGGGSADGSGPLRVARSPLKRRSAATACRAGAACRGLSRNYAGKSQSFDCISDLTRNPWGSETALSLAKRRAAALAAAPLAVPGALGSGPGGGGCGPCSWGGARRGSSLCDAVLLGWSIDEDAEGVLGASGDEDGGCGGGGGSPMQIPGRGRAGAGVSMDAGAAAAAAADQLASAVCLCDVGDDAAGMQFLGPPSSGAPSTATASAATSCAGTSPLPPLPPLSWPRGARPIARRSWDAAPRGISSSGSRTGGGGGVAMSAPHVAGGGGLLSASLASASAPGGGPLSPSPPPLGGGAAADELCAALHGARLSPLAPGLLFGADAWTALSAPSMMEADGV